MCVLPISAFTTTPAICHNWFACSHLISPRGEPFLSTIQLCIYIFCYYCYDLFIYRRVFFFFWGGVGGSVSKFLWKYTLPAAYNGESQAEDASLPWSWWQVASLPWGDAGRYWHVGLFAHRSISGSCQCPVKLLGLLFCAGLVVRGNQGFLVGTHPFISHYLGAWLEGASYGFPAQNPLRNSSSGILTLRWFRFDPGTACWISSAVIS